MTAQIASTTVHLTVHGIPLQLKISAPVEPVKARAMLPLFRSLTDAFTNLSEEQARTSGRSISCKKGCGACCRQVVPLAEIEAIELREMVLNMPEPRRAEILGRFKAALEQLEGVRLLERIRRLEHLTREQLTALGLEYFAQKIACPFLEDESCSIHPQRPLACREFLVVSPAEHCSRPQEMKVPRTELLADVSGAVRSFQAEQSAPTDRWIPLVMALEWAEAHPGEGPDWPGTEWIDELLAKLRKQAGQSAGKPT